jgi:hypothetical protein
MTALNAIRLRAYCRRDPQMTRTLIQLAAGGLLLLLIWRAFRLAMALRFDSAARDGERRTEEARGRRVVAEIPSHKGEIYLFLETAEAFEWQGRRMAKAEVLGCRLLLNGGLMASAVRPGITLPEPGAPEEYEGRERWDVRLHSASGAVDVPCGTLREGVSRDAARAVFEAVRASLTA